MKVNTTVGPKTKGVTKNSAGKKDEKREELEYDRLEYVATLPESAESKIEQKCPQKISNWLVGRRAFGEDELTRLSRDEVADRVLSLEHVWLDEEQINHIDNLEMLGVGVTHLYLHRNMISRIENLDCMRNLQLLSLASNSIRILENLLPLSCLKALDLGYNLIEGIEPGSIPPSVLYLTTDGNPLKNMNATSWVDLFDSLPDLRTHDCRDVVRSDEEGDDQDDEEAVAESEKEEDRLLKEDGGADRVDAEDYGQERIDWESGQLHSVMKRIAQAESIFDASMEGMKEKRRMMVIRQREELAFEMAEQEKQFLEAKEGLLRLRALMDEQIAESQPTGDAGPATCSTGPSLVSGVCQTGQIAHTDSLEGQIANKASNQSLDTTNIAGTQGVDTLD